MRWRVEISGWATGTLEPGADALSQRWLLVAPADYEQGESYRIIYVHVPAALLSMFVYVVMAVSSAVFLIWRMKLADVIAQAAAPIGASFTFLALVTGFFLLFLYFGYMALRAAIEQPQGAARAAAVLAVVGVVNIPIIHYSVEWWSTLHQPATITKMGESSIHPSMKWPLLLMVFGFQLLFFYVLLIRCILCMAFVHNFVTGTVG